MLKTRYGEFNPRGDNGQYCLFFLQVFRDDTVSRKAKDPAWSRGLGVLIVAHVLDFEGPVRPTSRNGTDPTVIQSEADAQVFNIRSCHDWVLNDEVAFSCQENAAARKTR